MKCKSCTLCCYLFPIKELNKPSCTVCKHCDKGCKIHDTKPSECTNFNCAYYQMENASEDLRPDNCKVIFERISERLFIGTLHPDYELTETARKQIVAFNKQGFSTLIVSPNKTQPILFLADGHKVEEIYKEWQEEVTKR